MLQKHRTTPSLSLYLPTSSSLLRLACLVLSLSLPYLLRFSLQQPRSLTLRYLLYLLFLLSGVPSLSSPLSLSSILLLLLVPWSSPSLRSPCRLLVSLFLLLLRPSLSSLCCRRSAGIINRACWTFRGPCRRFVQNKPRPGPAWMLRVLRLAISGRLPGHLLTFLSLPIHSLCSQLSLLRSPPLSPLSNLMFLDQCSANRLSATTTPSILFLPFQLLPSKPSV